VLQSNIRYNICINHSVCESKGIDSLCCQLKKGVLKMEIIKDCKAISPNSGIVKDFKIKYKITNHTIREIRGINGSNKLAYGDKIETIELPKTYTVRGKETPVTGIGSNVFNSFRARDDDDIFFNMGNFHYPIGELIIPEGIQVITTGAFPHLVADKLVWPSTCDVIPESCFSGTFIKQFEGFENVRDIKETAFYSSKYLTEFDWPKNAKEIPRECFSNCSKLEVIRGIENVDTIGRSAFTYTSIKKFVWPEQCRVIPMRCFAGAPLEEIALPGPITAIKRECFEQTNITELNLENSFVCEIDESVAAQGIKFVKPFYQV
jgi:hypothetical protein